MGQHPYGRDNEYWYYAETQEEMDATEAANMATAHRATDAMRADREAREAAAWADTPVDEPAPGGCMVLLMAGAGALLAAGVGVVEVVRWFA